MLWTVKQIFATRVYMGWWRHVDWVNTMETIGCIRQCHGCNAYWCRNWTLYVLYHNHTLKGKEFWWKKLCSFLCNTRARQFWSDLECNCSLWTGLFFVFLNCHPASNLQGRHLNELLAVDRLCRRVCTLDHIISHKRSDKWSLRLKY